jgi:hypothetical protein
VRYRSGGNATISIAVTIGILQFVFGIPIGQFIWEHPFKTLIFCTGWTGLGICWFIFKWDRFTKRHKKWYKDALAVFLENKRKDALTEDMKAEWWEYFRTKRYYGETIEYRPKFRNHKDELVGWLIYWPWSIIETFLFDFFVEFYNWIYEKFQVVLQRIMERNWAGIDDVPTEEQQKEYNQRRCNR